MLTLAMPIAILISSIMTFGNLGERFELVAIKSAGISLLRFMRPLMWVSVLLCGITFLFANYLIPEANLKFKSLYFSIMYKKPALDLREGKFYTAIPDYAIKVGKKEPDGKTIQNVIIFEQQNNLQDNCIIAKSGTMQFSPDEKYLDFTLYDGHRYQERGNIMDTASEFIRLDFKEYKKIFDIASIKMMNPPDSIFKNDNRVMSVGQLDKYIDSLKKSSKEFQKVLNNDFNFHLHYFNIPDSIWKKLPQVRPVKQFTDIIPDSAKIEVNRNAQNEVNNLKSTIMFSGSDLSAKQTEVLHSEVEWHHKFSLSLACLILFFIGAPLGSIIRKGGMGMPLVVAIIFFMIFHLLNMFGEKFARGSVVSPVIGMWLPIYVLAPVGFFLTYKAMHDSQLFNTEYYYRFFKKTANLVIPMINKIRNKKTTPSITE
jgi:lipopolysaccharide export system permease protein